MTKEFGPLDKWEKANSPGRNLDQQFEEFCDAFAKAIGAKSGEAVQIQIRFAMPETAKGSNWGRQAQTAILNKAAALAGVGWREYMKWRHHEGWSGLYLKENTRAIRRTEDGHTVADGVVFPILAALSFFVIQNKNGKWVVKIPSFFDETEMLLAARDQLSNHNGNPMHMGRDATIYDALASLTKMVVRLTKRVGTTA